MVPSHYQLRGDNQLNDNSQVYLESAKFPSRQIWVCADNLFTGKCQECGQNGNLWKIYSYADGYLQLCLEGITKYVESGLISPNMEGRVNTYDNLVLEARELSERSIPWKARIFCDVCDSKSQFTGRSTWRPDSNHLFVGDCDTCGTKRTGGIITLRMDTP